MFKQYVKFSSLFLFLWLLNYPIHCFALDSNLLRDPTCPTGNQTKDSDSNNMPVVMLFVSSSIRFAMLQNGDIVHVGDILDGQKIIDITHHAIVLQDLHGKRTIPLFQSIQDSNQGE